MELRHERRTANSAHLMAGDDQAQVTGKERLLDKTERFGGVADTPHVGESPLKDGFALERPERIVVNEQDC
jgi:hypothetical protein